MEQATELEYLQFFYGEADFGPADGDVRDMINRAFVRINGKSLPDGYACDEEDGE